MNYETLVAQIRSTRSYLCVGLDSDPLKIPAHLGRSPASVLAFNKAIIEATAPHCVAYKINTAFYEAMGWQGWKVLEETFAAIPDTHFKIADAKRGDIGNTSTQYAKAFFEQMNCDAVTVAPYMGKDSIAPFLAFPQKWTIVLALTSNPSAADFQYHSLNHVPLYKSVVKQVQTYSNPEQVMFVCGATKPREFELLRKAAPKHFFLVPGVGAQGGDLETISRACLTKNYGLLINASRSIIFASAGPDFAAAAKAEAAKIQSEMVKILDMFLL